MILASIFIILTLYRIFHTFAVQLTWPNSLKNISKILSKRLLLYIPTSHYIYLLWIFLLFFMFLRIFSLFPLNSHLFRHFTAHHRPTSIQRTRIPFIGFSQSLKTGFVKRTMPFVSRQQINTTQVIIYAKKMCLINGALSSIHKVNRTSLVKTKYCLVSTYTSWSLNNTP